MQLGYAHATVSDKSTSTRLSYRLGQINSFVWDVSVSEDKSAGRTEDAARRPLLLTLLAGTLFLEAAVMAVLAGFLLFELVTEVPASYASAVAIVVLAALATVWLVVIAVGALRAQPWVRAAALTWQVLQLAVAFGSFQGLFSRDDIGWFLLVPAVNVLFLLFTRSVMEATRRD